MRDTNGDGQDDYCRILKNDSDETFEALCNPGEATGFGANLLLDPSPPKDIQRLLSFYQGAFFWLRLRDDMLD